MQSLNVKKALDQATIQFYLALLVAIFTAMTSTWWLHGLILIVAAIILFDMSLRHPAIYDTAALVKYSAAFILSGTALYLGATFTVIPEFESASKYRYGEFPSFAEIYRQAPRIGHPVSKVIEAPYADIQHHQKAWLIWMSPLGQGIRIDDDGFELDFADPLEAPFSPSDELERVHLGLPAGCFGPTGGFAKQWEMSRPSWSRIGCRSWRCHVSQSALRYQIFENGYVIDGVPKTAGYDNNESWQFYIQKNKQLGTANRSASPEKVGCPEIR